MKLETPLRDEMRLNRLDMEEWEKSSVQSATVVPEQQLRLSELPMPKNRYEVSEELVQQKEEELAQMEEELVSKEDTKMEDVEVLEEQMLLERQKLLEIEKSRQSQVVKRSLPRPAIINQKMFKELSGENAAEKMIMEEMQQMLVNDNYKYPLKGMKEVKKPPADYWDIQEKYMVKAREMVREEAGEIPLDMELFNRKWEEVDKEKGMFFPGAKQFDLKSNHSLAEIIESKRFEFELVRSHMESEL